MGLFVTFATFWALALGVAGAPALGLGLLAIRLLAAALAGVDVMKSSQSARFLWLVPLRDLWSVLVWIVGLMPGAVEWRGRRMTLTSDGRICD